MNEKLDRLLFPKRMGKTIMQQKEWATKKCMDCGGKLELIICNEYEEVKQCQDCGRKTLILKTIRDEDGLVRLVGDDV